MARGHRIAAAAAAAAALAALLLLAGPCSAGREPSPATPPSPRDAASSLPAGPPSPPAPAAPGPAGGEESAAPPAGAGPAPGPAPDPAAARTLVVEVVDASGAPVPGAEVEVYANWRRQVGNARGADGPGADLPEPLARATADAAGLARPDAAGLAGERGGMVRASAAGAAGFREARLDAPGETRVRVAILPGLSLPGRVDLRDGPPVPDAEVLAWFPVGEATGLARTRTDAGGRFVLEGIPREAFRGGVEIQVPWGRGRWGVREALPPPDPPEGEVLVVVEPSCRLRGRCLDARGAPLEGVRVSVGAGPGHEAAGAATDAAGAFEFEAPRNTWSVIATSLETESLVREDVACEVPEVQLGDLVLADARKCRVRGRCVDGDGKGLAEAFVYAGAGPGHSAGWGNTDAEGRFDFKTRPGTWKVMVEGTPWWEDVVCEGAEVDLGTRAAPPPRPR